MYFIFVENCLKPLKALRDKRKQLGFTEGSIASVSLAPSLSQWAACLLLKIVCGTIVLFKQAIENQ